MEDNPKTFGGSGGTDFVNKTPNPELISAKKDVSR
jgi:hypothetical protein